MPSQLERGRLDDQRKAVGPVEPAPGEQPDAVAGASDDQAVAVVSVRPAFDCRSSGELVSKNGEASPPIVP
jgi:hypothetical protein